MSSNSELSSFAAQLREAIVTSKWGARTSPDSQTGAAEPDFEALAIQLFALQFKHNAAYRRLCEARGVLPSTVAHWTDIPAAPTSAFKELNLSCLPPAERTAVFHSSGTTGQRPSRHYHNAESLALYEVSLLSWFGQNSQSPIAHRQGPIQLPIAGCLKPSGVPGPSRQGPGRLAIGYWQLAILTPPPSQAPHSSLVHMFETIRRAAGCGEEVFVGRVAQDGGWTLDEEAALERLRAVSGSGQPLFVLGTAFSFVHLLDHLAARDLRLELPPGSCALETGGYKGRSRSLPKAALHGLISERLGIPHSQIICEYGMSELSSQAYDSASAPSRLTPHASRLTPHPSRPFTFPPWARVQIVSPETGCEVGDGETGLIRVFDLANVYSVMAIQTEDLGIRRGDGFALAGRAVFAEPRGCSLMAV